MSWQLKDWQKDADAAATDIETARTTLGGESDALLHLRNALENLQKAVEALETADEEQE